MNGYLDHAATSPMLPEAVEAMLPWLGTNTGNPSGQHGPARRARRALDDARDQLAAVLGVPASWVTFTSGGTEADNLAIRGAIDAAGGPQRATAMCSAFEHPAVLEPVEALGGTLIPVPPDGVLDPDAVAAAVGAAGESDDRRRLAVVSVMAVNNEIGTIQPVVQIAERLRALADGGVGRALVHCDAVQALPWLDLRPLCRAVDAVSVSAHKFGGPMGVGALIADPAAPLAAQQRGGGQERERRSGTQNVAGIVGMGVAAELTDARRADTVRRVAALAERLRSGLLEAVEDSFESGAVGGSRRADPTTKVAGTVHLCIPGIEAEALLFLLDQAGIAASAASSCASGADEPSHVLAALGIDRQVAQGALRLTLGPSTIDADVDAALAVIPPAVQRLRTMGS